MRICGFEALLRWNHPQRGMVSPAEFIPARRGDRPDRADRRMGAAQACAEAASWPGHLKIAVNLSPVQFKSRDLVQTVVNALAASGLPPRRLELEITESVLLHDSAATLETLRKLQTLGVRIALDDFGTGYSSLSYLRSFPFDKIKIDRSFISGLSDGSAEAVAIVRAMTQMGLSLGMSTTAEGSRDRRPARHRPSRRVHRSARLPLQPAQAGARDCKIDRCRVGCNQRVGRRGERSVSASLRFAATLLLAELSIRPPRSHTRATEDDTRPRLPLASRDQAPESSLRISATASSIIGAVTSRCVQARTRPPSRLRRTPCMAQRAWQLVARHAGAVGVEEDQVGVGFLHHHARDLPQAAGQRLGVGVVLGQAIDVVVERVEAGGGADAGLAHRAAEALLPAPGVADELRAAAQHGAERRAEALGEVEPDGVVAGRPCPWPRCRRRRRHSSAARRPCAWPSPARARRPATALSCASGQIAPPPILAVCSTSSRRCGGA